jgi:hypothetical protein
VARRRSVDVATGDLFPEPDRGKAEDTDVSSLVVVASSAAVASAPPADEHRYGDYYYATAVYGRPGGPSGYAVVLRRQHPHPDAVRRQQEIAIHSCHMGPDECRIEVDAFARTLMWRTQEKAFERWWEVRRMEIARTDRAWDRARELARNAAMFTDYDMREVVRRAIREARAEAIEAEERGAGEERNVFKY